MASRKKFAVYVLFIIGILAIRTCTPLNKRICGRELADTLRLICNNSYNGFGRITAAFEDSYSGQAVQRNNYKYQSIPFLSKLTGGVLLPRVRRKRDGVSSECCRKSCTYTELYSYCN